MMPALVQHECRIDLQRSSGNQGSTKEEIVCGQSEDHLRSRYPTVHF